MQNLHMITQSNFLDCNHCQNDSYYHCQRCWSNWCQVCYQQLNVAQQNCQGGGQQQSDKAKDACKGIIFQVFRVLKIGYKFKVAQKVILMAVAKQIPKVLPKVAAKSGIKKIPVVGAVAGIGFCIWRLLNGQVVRAVAEVASGAASTVPGAGTAASIAIDITLLAADIADELISKEMIV